MLKKLITCKMNKMFCINSTLHNNSLDPRLVRIKWEFVECERNWTVHQILYVRTTLESKRYYNIYQVIMVCTNHLLFLRSTVSERVALLCSNELFFFCTRVQTTNVRQIFCIMITRVTRSAVERTRVPINFIQFFETFKKRNEMYFIFNTRLKFFVVFVDLHLNTIICDKKKVFWG